jgi:hypothetical protein
LESPPSKRVANGETLLTDLLTLEQMNNNNRLNKRIMAMILKKAECLKNNTITRRVLMTGRKKDTVHKTGRTEWYRLVRPQKGHYLPAVVKGKIEPGAQILESPLR